MKSPIQTCLDHKAFRDMEFNRQPDHDYRPEAVMRWLCAETEDSEFPELLWQTLVAEPPTQFDALWKSVERVAIERFGRPKGCVKCGGDCRFSRLAAGEQYAIWECTNCEGLISQNGQSWQLDATNPKTARPNCGENSDTRYEAIWEWLGDPDLKISERRMLMALWFDDATSFDGKWRKFEDAARAVFPPKDACQGCQHRVFQFWRFGAGRKCALWRCEKCGDIEKLTENWRDAEARRLEIEARQQGARAAYETEVDELMKVRAVLPPPIQCFKCGESEWDFESVSPNVKAAKWKCTYCGRVELITSVEAPNPKEQAREAIPKAVQREVWRRDGGKCQRCGSQENLEFDHIIPVIRGGSSTARNLQLLCSICNGIKSDSEPGTH